MASKVKVGDQVVDIQVYLEPLVGVSAPVLFLSFGYIDWFRPLLFGMIFTIGVLVGLELPLLMRILKEHVDFEDLVSRVLTFDYIGALLASLLFPILFVPHLGLVRTSLIFGILNALVGLWGTYLLRPLLKKKKIAGLRGRSALAIGLLVVGVIKADSLTSFAEEKQLAERIVHAESSPYQRIVITENQTGFQLFLNGHLQFSSNDEYRYHEALVHPVFSGEQRPQEVLVLGGGDGLAVREILKYPSVKSVTLVDLDPSMTSLADRFPPLADLAKNALHDPRVKVINQDAFLWIDSDTKKFDAAIIDFPDPASYSVGKLYTTYFYKRLKRRLADRATIGIQCTSPLVAPQSYWCILRTMEESGFFVRSYHAAVPTFGIWGFALATLSPSEKDLHLSDVLTEPLRFLNQQVLEDLFVMPNDLVRVESEVNRLNDQVLVRYYDREWSRWQ